MKPEQESKKVLAITRSKAKLYEYGIPEEEHIKIEFPLIRLIDLTLGILGDFSADFESINIDAEKYNLLFSAKYFDAILSSKTVNNNSDFFKILASSAYYLSGYPGSANVILKNYGNIDLEANQLEKIIIAIIKKEIIDFNNTGNNPYKGLIDSININLQNFYKNGIDGKKLILDTANLKKFARNFGNDRELLFADIINALCLNYLKHSVWETLPRFSNLDISIWRKYLKRQLIKELWPAQLIIGKSGVFQGKSSIIQMPTSSGKTKSTELIIRSSFLSGRSTNAVIVAPLRALCQEIYWTMKQNFIDDNDVGINLTSDVLQYDLDEEINKTFNIIIVTPEKLDYILRQNTEFSEKIGLIIYDEGHLIDDISRGVKYELLLSSLKQKLSIKTQVVLISAVIPNPDDIGKWLIGDSFVLAEAKNILPLNRSLAFVEWTKLNGYLYFVNEENFDKEEFWVPNLLERKELELHNKERKKRYFPDKNPNYIALALGFKLIENGSVAIFVGKKRSAIKVANDAIDIFERGFNLKTPFHYSNINELKRLNNYIENLFGPESVQFKAGKLGIYIHHGSTPYGLRLAIEYAISKEHLKFIICTSTLAQGVNLPIRYLIITTSRQGQDEIKIRDFHNLIGRVGRAGVYTEGSIIFANNEIYENRFHWFRKYAWDRTKELLDPKKSENCKSHILTIYNKKPIVEKDIKKWELNIENIKKEIEKYLIIALEGLGDQKNIEEFTASLAKNTLAYLQAEDQEKEDLIKLFLSISREIIEKEKSLEKRKVFARATVSITEAQEILGFLKSNISNLSYKNAYELLKLLWPIIYEYSDKLPKTISESNLFELCNSWVLGFSFQNLWGIISEERISIRLKTTLDDTVNICENIFGFEGSFIIGSCAEILGLLDIESEEIYEELRLLQKMIKYGLPEKCAIIIYELGLTDRKLSLDISKMTNNIIKKINRKEVIRALIDKKEEIFNFLKQDYPSFFEAKFDEIIKDYETYM